MPNDSSLTAELNVDPSLTVSGEATELAGMFNVTANVCSFQLLPENPFCPKLAASGTMVQVTLPAVPPFIVAVYFVFK